MNTTSEILKGVDTKQEHYDIRKQQLEEVENTLEEKKVSEQVQVQVLSEFLKFMGETESETSIKEYRQNIVEQYAKTENNINKAEILQGNSYGYFDMIKGTKLETEIDTQLKAKGSKETVQERCEKIEGTWTSFISGSLETKLPQESMKSMSTGLSLYFTDRLNRSGADAGSIAKSTEGLTSGGFGSIVSKMFSVFGNISGFTEIMGSVNNAVKVINTHSTNIVVKGTDGKDIINPSCSEIFNTPHRFYDWMKGSLAVKNPTNTTITFEQAFTQFQGTSTKESLSTNVLAKLNYTPGVHALMDKVVNEGKSVLDLRNSSKDKVEEIVYGFQSQLNGYQGILSQLGIDISSIGDALDAVGLKGVGDFVCLLLGYGSVEGLEKKNRAKKFDKDMTAEEKQVLNKTIAYARKFMTGTYTPQTHNEPTSFLKTSGLSTVIERYNATDTKNKINLTAFPTSSDLIVDSFLSGFEDGTSFPDPSILQNIPELAEYITTTNDNNGNQITSLDETKKANLATALHDQTLVKKLVAVTLGYHQDPKFLAKFSETKKDQQPKDPSDFIGLLFTTCLAPTTAANAWKFDVVDRKNLGKGINPEISGRGAQIAQVESKKTLETDLEKAKQDKKDIDAEITKVKENKDKIYSEAEQKTKATELGTRLATADEKIKEIEKKLTEVGTVLITSTSYTKPEAAKVAVEKEGTDEIDVIKDGNSITKQDAIKKYGNSMAIRNFNPGNIGDLGFGGKKVEGERFTVFNSPQEGLIALVKKIKNIQQGGSKVYSSDMTITEYMHKYAPGFENNTEKYIQDVCKDLGISNSTQIKDIDATGLAIAHAKKEDGKSYQMLKDLEIIA